MEKRYLIINADDYGMCHSANAAVEDLFNNGYITSTTLMTPCPWAEDALMRAKANPKMHVGLHLTLNAEWEGYKWGSVAGRSAVPSLVDEGGYLVSRVAPLLRQAKREDVVTEINAQLDWMLSRGYRPTHIDNHMGSVYGLEGQSFLPEVFALCKQHGFAFRLPRSAEMFGKIPGEVLSQLEALVAYADANRIGTLNELGSNPYPRDREHTYETMKEFYLNLIRSAKPGITEIYVHPAIESAELKAICPKWQYRVWEYQLMLDDDVKKTIDEEGIELGTWIDAPFFA